MKQRNGFVSNSSSASFIIRWSKRDCEDRVVRDVDLGECLEELGFYPECNTRVFAENSTRQDDDGYFITDQFTAMLNTQEDFGLEMNALVAALVINKSHYKINSAEIDDAN